MSRKSILQVKNLTLSFRTPEGKLQAVRDISFDLFRGETLAIVGESGSGKSAMGKAILGISAPNAVIGGGEILFDGKDLLKCNEKELCAIRGDRIAMVFQDPMSSLNPIMRVGDQLTEVLRLKKKVSRAAAKKTALRILEQVGIPDGEKRFRQYPFELSGGMRQRIVIAIALMADPDILICDEPTTALDVTIQAQILELIGQLKRERNLSVIFITHDLGVVANVADRVAVMYAGKIVEQGTAENIFCRPAHPYTWALLSSVPDLSSSDKLEAIPGTPPDMVHPPVGDAFAARNPYALEIDFEQQPPMVPISDTHFAATWLLHPGAPPVEMPEIVKERIARMKEERHGG